MRKKIVLAGGTGLIGQYLEQRYTKLGYEVLIISRQEQHIQWHQMKKIVEALNGAALLVNLAGKSVNCRYNEKNKNIIMNSRTETTRILGDAILKCEVPPKLWINSSTGTIYRHAEDRPMTEANGEVGSGFSVEVAKAWEGAFFSYELPQTRQVALRISIVLGKESEIVSIFKRLTRLGVGGKQGSGNQKFSWIHIEDVYRIIRYIEEEEMLDGVINCAAPNPVTNKQLMATLRKTLKMPLGISTPAWLLEIGAVLIRTETELILKSRWVAPEKLIKHGFKFKFAHLEEALQNVIKK